MHDKRLFKRQASDSVTWCSVLTKMRKSLTSFSNRLDRNALEKTTTTTVMTYFLYNKKGNVRLCLNSLQNREKSYPSSPMLRIIIFYNGVTVMTRSKRNNATKNQRKRRVKAF